MTGRQSGSPDVRPNTLSDERAPNTFRTQATPGAVGTAPPAGTHGRDQGDVNAAPRRRWALPSLRLWVWVALAVAGLIVIVRLLVGPN